MPGKAAPNSAMLLPSVCQRPRRVRSPLPFGPRMLPGIVSCHAGPTTCWLPQCHTWSIWRSTARCSALTRPPRCAGAAPRWVPPTSWPWTQSGWGPGRLLAHGAVTPEVEQRTSITGKALRPGANRLWLRVKDTAGEEASTSLELTVQATPATTRAWPAGGVFGRPQKVTLFTERPATIYVTTDGSLPTLDSPR